jgi:flagellar biosynthesis/type III secretory pathway protein FliH
MGSGKGWTKPGGFSWNTRVTRLFNFILSIPYVDISAFEAKAESLNSENLTNKAMSAAEQYMQRGLAKGLEKGREEGLLIGNIQALQSLTTRRPTPVSTLFKKSLDELKAMLAELQARHLKRPRLTN